MNEPDELEHLRQENALLKAQIVAERKRADGLLIGVGNKRGVWVRWRRRQYPVTLYANEWTILFDHMDAIQQFIAAHHAELARPNDTSANANGDNTDGSA